MPKETTISWGKLGIIGVLTAVISITSSIGSVSFAYGGLTAQVEAVEQRVDDRDGTLVELYRSLDRRLGNIEAALIKGQ